MTDERLIEEAAKAIYDDYIRRYPEEPPMYHAGPGQPVWRHMARAALAVFEKAHTPTDDEREPHSHEGEPRVWCETHQHEHVASMPRFTYLCKDCGWGQWYGDQAREHEFWTQENLREAHTTYEVEHITRPLVPEPQGEPSDSADSSGV